MVAPSRDERESITLSSWPPHFGQRIKPLLIVVEHQYCPKYCMESSLTYSHGTIFRLGFVLVWTAREPPKCAETRECVFRGESSMRLCRPSILDAPRTTQYAGHESCSGGFDRIERSIPPCIHPPFCYFHRLAFSKNSARHFLKFDLWQQQTIFAAVWRSITTATSA